MTTAILCGYGDMGVTGLRALIAADVDVVQIYTYPAPPNEWQGSLSGAGCLHDVPVSFFRPTLDEVKELRPDLILSCYYKDIIPKRILDVPRVGSFNLHGSLLPRYRGRCPLNWAILNGEAMTGVTLHHMTERVDAGDVVFREPVHISQYDRALDVFERQRATAFKMIANGIPAILDGEAPRIPQDEARATFYGGRTPDMGRVDWRWDDVRVHDLVRAVAPPWPGAFSFLDGVRVAIVDTVPRRYHWVTCEVGQNPPGTIGFDGNRPLVACGNGSLYLGEIQIGGESYTYKKLADWAKKNKGRVFE